MSIHFMLLHSCLKSIRLQTQFLWPLVTQVKVYHVLSESFLVLRFTTLTGSGSDAELYSTECQYTATSPLGAVTGATAHNFQLEIIALKNVSIEILHIVFWKVDAIFFLPHPTPFMKSLLTLHSGVSCGLDVISSPSSIVNNCPKPFSFGCSQK